jgi:hypothetical protein
VTGIFDGVTGVLADVFGAPVTVTPEGGVPYQVVAIFRDTPVVLGQGEGGDVFAVETSLQVRKPAADAIATGAGIDPGNGKTYTVLNSLPSGSPAWDAFITFQLEETG